MDQNKFYYPLTIKDFDILEKLGEKYHSSVYKVKYKKIGGIYTLKTKEREKFNNNDKEIDYLREKTILYDLTKRNHPHIVKLYAEFQDNNYRYLVMEYCKGTTLEKLRGNEQNKGYVDQKLVIHILTQLLETLKYLHETCYIIHRDIRPDKIILGHENNIKLLGFGIAAYLTHPKKQLVSNKSLKAIKSFAPPEIIFDQLPLNYDYKIDIFSLGFTIFSLMNPSENNNFNLPVITEGCYGNIRRYENKIINKFYDTWLIDFVKLLYENDKIKRPSASEALSLLQLRQPNPNFVGLEQNMNFNLQNNIQNGSGQFNYINNNLLNENQKLKLELELNQYKKENEDLKTLINNLQIDNNRLNNELIKANKIISKFKNIPNNQHLNDNEINKLKEIIKMKDNEINNLTNQLKNNVNKKLINYDDIMVVNFISSDQRINCGIKCLETDTFAEVEEKLYQQYNDCRETNNNFIAKGKLVLRFKKLSENGIKNGDRIQLVYPQYI